MSSIRFVICVVAICLSACLSFAQQQSNSSSSRPEDQIIRVERDWLAADGKGDVASLRQIISDDFMGSSFDGGLLTKEDIIPEGGRPGGFAGATPGQSNVRVFGDTGVLMGTINPAGAQAKPIRVTLVCQKRSQGWQIVAAQLARTQ